MKIFRRILVATDFSEASIPAFELSLRLAKACAAELLVAHAYEEPNLAELSSAHVGLYEEFDRRLREEAQTGLQALVDRARNEGIEAHALVLTGFADEAIVKAATGRDADLIVMGTHGRRGAAHLFLGSVAARVVARAHCPVTTVRAE